MTDTPTDRANHRKVTLPINSSSCKENGYPMIFLKPMSRQPCHSCKSEDANATHLDTRLGKARVIM